MELKSHPYCEATALTEMYVAIHSTFREELVRTSAMGAAMKRAALRRLKVFAQIRKRMGRLAAGLR